jgi:hypothetical protein
VISRSKHTSAKSTVTKETRRMTPFRHFATRISFLQQSIFAFFFAHLSGGEKRSRADSCAAEERRAKRGKDAGSVNSSAIRATEDAAPRSFVASARARRRAALGCVAVAMGLFLTTTPALAAEPTGPYEIETFTARTTTATEADYTTAGGHPDQNLTAFTFRSNPLQEPKDIAVTLPPGFFGNPAAAPRCPFGDITVDGAENDTSTCPPGSKVGEVVLTHTGLETPHPLFNVVPPHGFPAAFAFVVHLNVVLLFATPLPRTAAYGLEVGSTNAIIIGITGFSTDFYGVPSQHGSGSSEAPFLSNPVDCSEAEPAWKLAADSWENAGTYLPSGFPDLSNPNWKTASVITPPVTGCEDPALTSQWHPGLATKPLQPGGGALQADQPTGLAVDLDFPQSNDPTDTNTTFEPETPQAPEPKNITVKLPAGLSISPSSATGLGACSDQASDPAGDQVHYDNTEPASCPDASKIGSVTATSPLLARHDPIEDEKIVGPEPIPGSVYLLKPHPGDLPIGGGNQEGKFRLLIELENPRYGVNFKLPGIATADPNTGQLSATFTQNPQLPASHITVNLKEGPRAPLASPTGCGSFTSTSDLVPWSSPGTPDAHPTGSFAVTSGPNGSGCPLSPAARPFAPVLSAGTESSKAGASTPFVMKLTRNDGEQELSSLALTTPKGFSAKLAGVPYCSDAAIAAAAGKSGSSEQSSPSCPAASQVGTITAGAGPGSNPFYASGKAYLAGPYKGAPLSFAFITPAVAGPFDLGNVVVRAAAYVDPETAQVTVKTDPLPQIIDGVPLRLRSITARIDRSDFTLNPTNCSAMSVNATLTSADGATANPSNAFQVGSCKDLGFKPDLKLNLKGGTKRSDHPALKATLTYPKGNYANIAKAVVSLPHSEFLAQNHIKTICTRVQFAADQCPAGSIYGYVTATTPLLEKPLEGPLYLRSSSHPLPDLVAALHGQIDVDLVGRIDSKNGGIRTTFESVPDAPVSKFVLSMQGGKKGLLENSRNLCATTNKADVAFTAQNGKTSDSTPVLTNSCKKARSGKKGKGANKGSKGSKRTVAWLPSLGF